MSSVKVARSATPVVTRVLDPGPLLLVASIGNPSKYDGTRHSVGHYTMKKLVDMYAAAEVPVGRFVCHSVADETVEVVVGGKRRQGFQPLHSKSQVLFYRCPGYMNVSGGSLRPFYSEAVKYARSQNRDLRMVVLFDELDLDVGKVKVRKQGSSHRGHNGLRDIQAKIGKAYTGVQIGIGREYAGDKAQEGVVADYVLSKFTQQQLETIDDKSIPQVRALLEEFRVGRYVNDSL